MTSENGMVRRRINGWYMDEMLEICNKLVKDNAECIVGVSPFTLAREMLCVVPAQCFEGENAELYHAEESNLIYTDAVIGGGRKSIHP